jgi:hypothetical protein
MNTFADSFEDDFGSAASGDLAKAVTATAAQNAAHVQTCPKCSGRGVFVSYSGRVLGDCFACKGKGTQSFKTSPAARAHNRDLVVARKERDAEKTLADFATHHPAEAAWVEASRATFGFAQSMHDAVQKFGSLTANQLAACTRAAEKVAARKVERAAAVDAAPVIDMTKIEAAFAAARSNGLKSLKLRIADLVISPAKATSANAGALYVKSKGSFDDSTYFGKIIGGKFVKSRECDASTEAQIIATATDPLAAAIAYGRATGSCSCCGRELTNKVSIDLGIGPICRDKWGF